MRILLAVMVAFTSLAGLGHAAEEITVRAVPTAEAVLPTPTPSPIPAFTMQATAVPTAAPTAIPGTSAPASNALPGVYKAYTPPPTPAPAPGERGPQITHVSLAPPDMALSLRGGATMPLGDTAKFNTAGPSGGLDFIYQASDDMGLDAYIDYAGMPYKDSAASQALGIFGGGFRFAYTFFNLEGVRPFARLGVGYYFATRATEVLKGYTPLGKPITALEYQGASGMGFTGGLGGGYAINDRWEAQLSLDVTSIGLAGGTGDNFLYATPALGIAFTF